VTSFKNKTLARSVSRRVLLRGAGVALALPWLESLAPRVAGAQAVGPALRFVPVFLPNGASEVWTPQGAGGAWSLSSVLAPLQAFKAKMSVLTNLENGSSFNPEAKNYSVEPSHGRQPGGWLTCVNSDALKKQMGLKDDANYNGPSVDQVMAEHAVFKNKTPVGSLQVGLSTAYSFCDNRICSLSRSVSWRNATTPLYKAVDPLVVFNSISSGIKPSNPDDPELKRRVALNKSVLDNVLDNAKETRDLLSVGDQQRMDEFMDSVRAVEVQATGMSGGMGGVACAMPTAPSLTGIKEDGIRQTSATYDKGKHASVMNDLIALAFRCDVTRIISYMLEDERSEFVYDNVPKQKFTATSATPGSGVCGQYHGAQHGTQDEFATITWYNVGLVADLCSKLDAIKEADGRTALDNSVILFGGAMHGSDHSCDRLPTALIGGGGGKLKTDQHVVTNNRPLRHLHYTLMNEVFGMGVTDFGTSAANIPLATLTEILNRPA
jgi:hypothetical protein